MPKFEVQIVETDEFGWNRRLIDAFVFNTVEAAEEYRGVYNNAPFDTPLIKENIVVALAPKEIVETYDGE